MEKVPAHFPPQLLLVFQAAFFEMESLCSLVTVSPLRRRRWETCTAGKGPRGGNPNKSFLVHSGLFRCKNHRALYISYEQ